MKPRPFSVSPARDGRTEAGADALGAVPYDRLVQQWGTADERARAFLKQACVPVAERDALVRDAISDALRSEGWQAGGDAVSETMAALRGRLASRSGGAFRAELDPDLAWRVERATEGAESIVRGGRLWSTPPLERRGMVPEGFATARRTSRDERGRRPWMHAARRRRFLLGLLILLPSIVASGFMADVLPQQGRSWLEASIVVVFGALFGWISVGFWTAIAGFFVLLVGRDRFSVTRPHPRELPESSGLPPDLKVAMVMPICEEPVERVFAGLRATRRSLERTGRLDRFDFFVLSDSVQSDTVAREEEAWLRWCRETQGFGSIFYRRRKARLARKTGNVADFLRRFGKRYRYMVVLDADSLMGGETIVRLASVMEAHPEIGLVQTVPTGVNRRSLFARTQQFATRVYGPMFAAGLHFWQLGDGQYWGHNAMVRVEPFMDHCALPRIPGKPPLGGDILSHDFVEGALLARAGCEVWLAYDLPESWEEVPSTLLEEMQRDRRWCQGNLQHARLLFTKGLYGAHRALFLNGVFSYMSALLWLAFLTLNTLAALKNVLVEPDYFPHGESLFPEWPVWRPDWALALFAVTAAILFLPKFLSVLLVVFRRGESRAHGGVVRLVGSVLLEILLSTLLAPIRMAFHTRFVLTNLLGRTVSWKSLGREDAETSWAEALRRHGFDTVVSSAWAVLLLWLDPVYFWWVTPIVAALVLSLPVSVLTSRIGLGDAARRAGLLLVPEESVPPVEIRGLNARQDATGARVEGFVRLVVDPLSNAVHRTLLGGRRLVDARIRSNRECLVARALEGGPAALSEREKRLLLRDPTSLDALHRGVWALSDPRCAGRWLARGEGPESPPPASP